MNQIDYSGSVRAELIPLVLDECDIEALNGGCSFKIVTNLWSIDTSARSSLCLLLNMDSFWGISSSDGGPKGVHTANSASGGSSVLWFWP